MLINYKLNIVPKYSFLSYYAFVAIGIRVNGGEFPRFSLTALLFRPMFFLDIDNSYSISFLTISFRSLNGTRYNQVISIMCLIMNITNKPMKTYRSQYVYHIYRVNLSSGVFKNIIAPIIACQIH
jgi:hypothetical protein